MLEEAKKFTKEHHMIEEGSRVIAGVSGGADSVCLLLLLLELQKEMTFELRVVHVEHGIRGQESLADCEFVEKMCGRLGVECKSHHIDVPKEAKQCGRTLEETARLMRYEIFEKEAESWGGAKIAVAHNRGDDAETVLFHLKRIVGNAGHPSGTRECHPSASAYRTGRNPVLFRRKKTALLCGCNKP